MVVKKIINYICNIVLVLTSGIAIYIVLSLLFFSTYYVPTSSMAPELIPGDNILVCKAIFGPRFFNIGNNIIKDDSSIIRLPGLRSIKYGDIVVFNNPYPSNPDTMEMDIFKYLVKRCIALPGDTLRIENGIYKITSPNVDSIIHVNKTLSQQLRMKGFKKYHELDTSELVNGWDLLNYGPYYIPKVGETVQLNEANFNLYKKQIEWETGQKCENIEHKIHIGGKNVDKYTFQKNYYFFAGDNVQCSIDSRYWGVIPEDYIAGVAIGIWLFKDSNGNICWERCLKMLH